MANLRLHLVYLAVIGFLTYQYWAKAQISNNSTQSIEHFDSALRANNQVVDKTAMMLYHLIQKDVARNPYSINNAFLEKAKNFILVSSSLNTWFEKLKTEFASTSGGFDKKDSTLLANRFSTKTGHQFFSEQRIKDIKDSLNRFQDSLMDIGKRFQNEDLKKQYGMSRLLNDAPFWQSLTNTTDADALSRLTYIQNRLELDMIPYLNYVYHIVAYDGFRFDSFKVAIAPQKAALIEGETFRADIYLAAYSSTPGSDVSIIINNREIPLKEGVSHFEKTEYATGKKTIKAEARIKNPLTGHTTSSFGEFEYEVLPKCSRDCK